jgi:hypothetical protein
VTAIGFGCKSELGSSSYGCQINLFEWKFERGSVCDTAPGFIEAGREDKVLKLRKALYALHQAPRAWYQKLDESLLLLGF